MSAFEGNRVDYPYIPFIAKRVDVTVGDCPMTAGLIDGLSLLLSGNCGSIFIAAHTALETLCGGLCNRLCNGEMVKVIPSGLGEEEDMYLLHPAWNPPFWGLEATSGETPQKPSGIYSC